MQTLGLRHDLLKIALARRVGFYAVRRWTDTLSRGGNLVRPTSGRETNSARPTDY